MEHLQQLETVRRVVQVKFATYGANNDQGCSETILVRDSHYCLGRADRQVLRFEWRFPGNPGPIHRGRNGGRRRPPSRLTNQRGGEIATTQLRWHGLAKPRTNQRAE